MWNDFNMGENLLNLLVKLDFILGKMSKSPCNDFFSYVPPPTLLNSIKAQYYVMISSLPHLRWTSICLPIHLLVIRWREIHKGN